MQKGINIINNFLIDDEIIEIKPYGCGHINDTYLVTCKKNKYVVQRINHLIFKKPWEVMENIINICNHLKEKVLLNGGNPERETLTFIPAKDGSYLAKCDGNYYRAYNFVDDAITYQTIEDPMHFYSAGKAYGKFQNMLADFGADRLYETIENFHNTYDRFLKFEKALSENKADRKELVKDEIDFVIKRKDKYGIIVDLLNEKKIPLRVTHNDTKLNNVLMDDKTGEAICVIDLDTVMPSSLLCDFGDAIRFGTNTAEEDEKDLSKVTFDINLFEQFAKGFLEEMKESITPTEVEYLPFSSFLLTIECGIRFLTDYLDGDVYFKTHRENHNLDRARTQFKLAFEMEQREEEMKEIINRIYKNL